VLFVALDANFCLRRHAVLNNMSDPSLSQGWAYFVEDTAFKQYLCDHKGDIQEVCINGCFSRISLWSRKAHVQIIVR